MAHFGDGSRWGVRIHYVTPRPTWERPGRCNSRRSGSDEPVLVDLGDIVTDFDLAAAVEFHRAAEAEATMVLTRVENPLAYGIVITDATGRHHAVPGEADLGRGLQRHHQHRHLPPRAGAPRRDPGRPEYDFGKDLFPALLREGRPVSGHVADGYWRDIGDLVEYRLAHLDLLQRQVQLTPPGRRVEGVERDIWLDDGARVDFTAHLRGRRHRGAGRAGGAQRPRWRTRSSGPAASSARARCSTAACSGRAPRSGRGRC